MSDDHSTHAIAYLRVSGKSQIDGDGFPRQIECIERYAAAKGLTIVDTYKDEAVSGTKELAHRAGLADLLERVQTNGVRIVLVETSQRIARDLMVGEVILAEFRKIGVTVFECEGGNDLTVGDSNPTAKLIRQILGAIAEFDKTMTVLKLRVARERIRKATGRCGGEWPFGYDPKRPLETRAIQALLRYRKEGLTWREVADKLNSNKFRTRQDCRWDDAYARRAYFQHRKYQNAGFVLPECRGRDNPGADSKNDQGRSESEGAWGVA